MTFTQDYKQRVFDTLKNHWDTSEVMSTLEKGDEVKFRLLLDDISDKILKDIGPKQLHSEEEVILHNSKVAELEQINELYNEFLGTLVKELDEQHQIKANSVYTNTEERA